MEIVNIINKCRDIKELYQITNDEIFDMIQNNHDFVSKRTIQRFFSSNENYSFRFTTTVKPIYDVLIKLEQENKTVSLEELISEKDKEIQFLKEENKYLKKLIDSLIELTKE